LGIQSYGVYYKGKAKMERLEIRRFFLEKINLVDEDGSKCYTLKKQRRLLI